MWSFATEIWANFLGVMPFEWWKILYLCKYVTKRIANIYNLTKTGKIHYSKSIWPIGMKFFAKWAVFCVLQGGKIWAWTDHSFPPFRPPENWPKSIDFDILVSWQAKLSVSVLRWICLSFLCLGVSPVALPGH